MSRFDSDLDFYHWLNGGDEPQATASCADCGVDIVPSTNPCCDACSDRRERWADALEAREQAKATIRPPTRAKLA